MNIPRYSLGMAIGPGLITYADIECINGVHVVAEHANCYHPDPNGKWCRYDEVKNLIAPKGFCARVRWLWRS